MQMLAIFKKPERLRHIGHLDLMRSMQRALRRSGLPVAYSQGFNPHILLTFASALTVGAVGEREIMSVSLTQNVTEADFLDAMNKALPLELQLFEVKAMDDRHPAMMSLVYASDWSIRIFDQTAAQKIQSILDNFMSQSEINAIRKTKSGEKEVNIRPFIFDLSMAENTIHAVLKLTETESCKPDMLLSALCRQADIEQLPRIGLTRHQLLGIDKAGTLCALETI